jgi:hypothetical protein
LGDWERLRRSSVVRRSYWCFYRAQHGEHHQHGGGNGQDPVTMCYWFRGRIATLSLPVDTAKIRATPWQIIGALGCPYRCWWRGSGRCGGNHAQVERKKMTSSTVSVLLVGLIPNRYPERHVVGLVFGPVRWALVHPADFLFFVAYSSFSFSCFLFWYYILNSNLVWVKFKCLPLVVMY